MTITVGGTLARRETDLAIERIGPDDSATLWTTTWVFPATDETVVTSTRGKWIKGVVYGDTLDLIVLLCTANVATRVVDASTERDTH